MPARRRKRTVDADPRSPGTADPTAEAARLFAERYAADKEAEKAAQRARRAAAEREAHHADLVHVKDEAATLLKRVRQRSAPATAVAEAEEAYRVALAALLEAERDADTA